MEEGRILDLVPVLQSNCCWSLSFLFSWLFGLQLELIPSVSHVLGKDNGPCKMLWLKS